jgi:hypothetical protein
MATIDIRVVGIYMNESVTLNLTSSTTVKDVLQEYAMNNPIGQPRGFQFQDDTPRNPNAPSGALSPTHFSYHVPNDPNVLNTKGGRTIMPGQYSLSEPSNFQNPVFNPFQAFQYYVLEDVNGGTMNKSRGGGFDYYNEQTTNYTLKDGDTIVWRQVSIKLQPDFRLPLHVIPPPLRQLDDETIRQVQQMRRTGMLSEEEFQEMVEDLRESGNEQVVLGMMQDVLERGFEG